MTPTQARRARRKRSKIRAELAAAERMINEAIGLLGDDAGIALAIAEAQDRRAARPVRHISTGRVAPDAEAEAQGPARTQPATECD